MREYFESEIRKLREEAKSFAEQYPEQARQLNIETQDCDPYIERLLEGTAYLTAQIRQRIDDDLPDICESLLLQLAPQLIRPYPGATIIEFKPRLGQLQQTYCLPKGVAMRSKPVGEEQTSCEFSTIKPIKLQPMHLTKVHVKESSRGGSQITLSLQADPGIELASLDLRELLLFLHADLTIATHLFMALTHELREVKIHFPEYPTKPCHEKLEIIPAHLGPDTAMLPGSGRHFTGYHLLQDYFSFREKYLFVNIVGLDRIDWPSGCQQFELSIQTACVFPPEYRLTNNHFKLHCVPAINCFDTSTEPIKLTHKLTEYPVVIDATHRSSKQLFAIQKVIGTNDVSGECYEYTPMHEFIHRENNGCYYHYLMREGSKDFPATHVSIGGSIQYQQQSLSLQASATNGYYPGQFLGENQINQSTEVPEYIQFANLRRPTTLLLPPKRSHYRWYLLAHLSLSYQSLTDLNVLHRVLSLYDWSKREENKRRIAGISAVQVKPMHHVQQGALMQSLEFIFNFQEQHYTSLADIYLFGFVLHHFLAHYVSINHSLRTRIHCYPSNKEFIWQGLPGENYPI